MKASVIIATRDRADRLLATLRSFEAMAPPPDGWELLVVDNGSSDETASVIEAVRGREAIPLVHLIELRPGKPLALNAGLARASGDIVAFTDDDCIVPRDWLASIVEEFRADPRLGGVGGRVELYQPTDQPVAVRTCTERRALSSPRELYGFIIGCNMALTRRVIDDIGPFDPFVGPGAPIPSGNDIDIIYRAYRRRHLIVYAPNILVYHNHGRQSEAAVESVQQRYAIGRGAFYAKYALAGDWAILRMGAREVYDAMRDFWGDLRAGRSPHRQLRLLSDLAAGFWRRLWLAIRRGRSRTG
jgi:glycosyltransferase involved in cell wall biosynthesis